MTRKQFLDGLKQELRGLPQREIEQTLHYYTEIIADRMEEGMTEEEAVAKMEPMHVIARRVAADFKGAAAPRAKISGFMIAMIILGFPLWFPLLVTGAALMVVMLTLAWVMVLVLWAVCLALFSGGMAAINTLFIGGYHFGVPVVGQIGLGMAAMGLSIFLFYGAKGAIPLATGATLRLVSRIKKGFVRRGIV
jgi:uncharacterized membrane protein